MDTTDEILKRVTDVRETSGHMLPSAADELLAELEKAFTHAVWVKAEYLYGVTELAQLLSVGATTITSWAANENIGFPLPVKRNASGSIWDVTDVIKWYAAYVPKQGFKKAGSLEPGLIAKFVD